MPSFTRIDIDSRTPPDDCQTMAEVRQSVDAIDRALVALIAQRQGYMDAAARIKPDRNVVHDAARIEQVVANVKAEATLMGLSHGIAEPVWRTMIARCIAYEFEVFDRLHADERVQEDARSD